MGPSWDFPIAWCRRCVDLAYRRARHGTRRPACRDPPRPAAQRCPGREGHSAARPLPAAGQDRSTLRAQWRGRVAPTGRSVLHRDAHTSAGMKRASGARYRECIRGGKIACPLAHCSKKFWRIGRRAVASVAVFVHCFACRPSHAIRVSSCTHRCAQSFYSRADPTSIANRQRPLRVGPCEHPGCRFDLQ